MALIANRVEYACPYCNEEEFSAPNEILLMGHIRGVHSLYPNFSLQCSKDGCERTFRNFRTYQNHLLSHKKKKRKKKKSLFL